MTLSTFDAIVGEAITNKEFREALLKNPHAAVLSFDLPQDELDLFSVIRAESVDSLARQLLPHLHFSEVAISPGCMLERATPVPLPAGRVRWAPDFGT